MTTTRLAVCSIQSTNICGLVRRTCRIFAALTVFIILGSIACHAQGGVPLVTVATDQSSLPLSNQFGVPAGTAINQAGDFAFVGHDNNALFFRAAGASSASLILQSGDPAPGFQGSAIQSFSSTIGLNSAKVLLFEVGFSLPDGLAHAALLTYDGSNFNTVVSSDDVAPGSAGANYGPSITPGSINDDGDLSFAAVPTGQSAITYFIVPSGGMAVRVAGLTDTPPAACTWCGTVADLLTGIPLLPVSPSQFASGLNSLGQMLITFDGGLFIGSKDGLVLVPRAAAGGCSPPPPPVIQAINGSAYLNNLGVVAFMNTPSGFGNTLCVAPAGGGTPVAGIAVGAAAPAAIGGGTLASLSVLAIDDAGDVLVDSQISGGSTTYALFRYHSSNGQMDVVAYNGEVVPAPDGNTFASPSTTLQSSPPTTILEPAFNGVSMANGGLVTFNVLLARGGTAIYQQTGTSPPVEIPVVGQAAPSTGGGTFGQVFPGQTTTFNNGSIVFSAVIKNGTAGFGDFLVSPGGIQTLMTTGDTLPSSARLTFNGPAPRSAGHFLAFTAEIQGGIRSLLLSDTSLGATTKIASDPDTSPLDLVGLPNPNMLSNFFLNESGQVAYELGDSTNQIIVFTGASGSLPVNSSWFTLTSPPCGTIFMWSPSGGTTKIVATGDVGPDAGSTFSCASLTPGPLSPLNNAGQLSFYGILSNSTSGNFSTQPLQTGVFVYSPTGTINELVETSGSLPDFSDTVELVPPLSIPLNSGGETAFGAQVGSIPNVQVGSLGGFVLPGNSQPGFQGFFLSTPTGAPTKVVGSGDPVPGNSVNFSFPHFISGLDDNGVLAFTAASGSVSDGLFLAPATGNIQTLALDGGAAPGGGTFSLASTASVGGVVSGVFNNFALMNNEADLAFRAAITARAGDSGYFRELHAGSGAGSLLPVVVQGQAVPGGGTFSTFSVPDTQGSDFALGPDGALAFVNNFTNGSSGKQGAFVALTDGTLLKVLATGDTVPGGGTVSRLSMSQGLAAGGAGQFAFWAGIQGGSAQQAIFVTAIPPGTSTSTTTVGALPTAPVFGQQITLTATVASSANGSPTGNVSFFDSGVLLGAVTLSSGQATLNVSSLATGAHAITAQYSGDVNFASSTSTASPLGISPRTTATTITTSSSSIVGGQSVTFIATVTTSPGGAPTGSVTFLDNGASIGTATLNGSAMATFSTSAFGVGTHPIIVSYAGDTNSATSTSTTTNEIVSVAGFAPSPSSLSVTAGQSISIPLTLYAAPGSGLTFTLGCSGLPVNASCGFGPNPVTPGAPPNGTAIQLTFSTMAGSSLFPKPPRGPSPRGLLWFGALLSALAMAGILMLRQTPRRTLASLFCLTAFGLALVITGCSAGGSGSAPAGTPRGAAAFTVTGTSGSIIVTATVNVTVQ